VSAYLSAGHFVRASTSFRGEERFDDVARVPTEHVHDCVSGAVESFDVSPPARLLVLFRFWDETPAFFVTESEFALLRLYTEMNILCLGHRHFALHEDSHLLVVPLSLYRTVNLIRDPRTPILFFLQNSRLFDKTNSSIAGAKQGSLGWEAG
jgi:hypothetical protein